VPVAQSGRHRQQFVQLVSFGGAPFYGFRPRQEFAVQAIFEKRFHFLLCAYRINRSESTAVVQFGFNDINVATVFHVKWSGEKNSQTNGFCF
jgi:hypothetical protein